MRKLIAFVHKKIGKAMRLFSISSYPSENIIAITTKIGENPSDRH